ncbi:MAG: phosphopyruvate hydratase [Clostridia bacterium]|nr:phosphopyruvate hydratase [Clostridia bacterium]
MESKIIGISAREILDSRGNPTVEAKVTLTKNISGTAAVPSGASTGSFEAVELRDGDKKRYFGKGVLNAIKNVNTIIRKELLASNPFNQKEIDEKLIKIDGTENKAKLGANAILAVSLANARACSKAKGVPLYQYLGNRKKYTLPVPMCNILNGGAHASNNIDIQEFMIVPIGAKTFTEGVRWCAEIFHTLKKLLSSRGFSTAVGDEGGFTPDLKNAEQALDLIIEAIKGTGYIAGKDIKIAIDAAVNEWFTEKRTYLLPKAKIEYTAEQLMNYWCDLVKKYPIISLEDPFHEEDWESWVKLTKKIGKSVQIVGDDLYVTNPKRLEKGIKIQASNSILIKPNQIGTLTETLETIEMAHKVGFTTVISHRSGETEDTTIADLSVAVGTAQIKTGSLSRSERVAKYNRLMQIEAELGKNASYCGENVFSNLK